MRIKLLIEASADGYSTEQEELLALRQALCDIDSSAVSIHIIEMERVPNEHSY